MDGLECALDEFQVTSHPNNPNAPHPFQSLYKSGRKTDQVERRKNLLEEQNKRRFDGLLHLRKLTNNDDDDVDDDGDTIDADDDDETNKASARSCAKKAKKYKDQLMLSEWMMEVPDNFPEDWLMVPCPIGKRNLIVTNKNTTCAYSKSGQLVERFPSLLPGGSVKSTGGMTILDCIFSEREQKLYVLDMMCLKNQPYYETEFEFRYYLASSKLAEIEGIAVKGKWNKYPFVILKHFSCAKSDLVKAAASHLKDSATELDGLLFYHKEGHYCFGASPLALWLKPYMLPEALAVPIPTQLSCLQPADYRGFQLLKHTVENQRTLPLEKIQSEQTAAETLLGEMETERDECSHKLWKEEME